MKTSFFTKSILAGALALAPLSFAQDEPVAPPPYPNTDAAGPNTAQNGSATNGGWRRLGQANAPTQPPVYPQQAPPPNYQPPPPTPAQLTIQPGTFLTVRLNQVLSSDHNQQGDGFTASLVKPLVVDGWIVADRGQTIAGRVSEAKKAGRIQGTSALGIELTDLTLIDGQSAPLHTQMVNRSGGTSVGRDAVGVGATTGIGAAAGAAADAGRGAAIGAGAGAAAGVIGVLLTRGQQTVLYPEMVLTFRVETPITVNTGRAPQAFRPVGQGDYDQPQDRPSLQARPAPRPNYGPVYGGWGYPYGYGYPYYWGPSVGIRFGGYYGGHGRWR